MRFDIMGQYINISAATCHMAVEITILTMEYNVCKLQPKAGPKASDPAETTNWSEESVGCSVRVTAVFA
jgi:hypothetical protein